MMPVSLREDYPMMAANSGQCYCCNAGRRDVRDAEVDGGMRKERVVDLGVSIDMEGYLLICETCVREAAGLLGMIVPDQRDSALRLLADIELDNTALRQERDEAKQFARVVIDYREREAAAATTTVGVPEPAVATVTAASKPVFFQVSSEIAQQAAEDAARTAADGVAVRVGLVKMVEDAEARAAALPTGPVEVAKPAEPVRKTKPRAAKA